jgi:hypothetical protein
MFDYWHLSFKEKMDFLYETSLCGLMYLNILKLTEQKTNTDSSLEYTPSFRFCIPVSEKSFGWCEHHSQTAFF